MASTTIPSMTILRLPQVKAKTGLGRATIYAQQAEGLFPPNFSLGARAVGWIESEIEQVIVARAAGADPATIKALVADLVARRGRNPR
jgi:prophage regulatory protein